MSKLCTISEANDLIVDDRTLHIAGCEKALCQLRGGTWIGGTIPYFLTEGGGVVSCERVMVTELSDAVEADIRFIDPSKLDELPRTAFENGFSVVVVPGLSQAHSRFAKRIHDVPDIFVKPMVGWVSGVHLDQVRKLTPKVFNGQTGEASAESIVVLHARLPDRLAARVGIVNLFKQGAGDRIRFLETGFSADRCLINDEPASFFDYVQERQLDLRLPLVADHSGEMINVSFQSVDVVKHCVRFYAPVLKGEEYRYAAPIGDYRTSLGERLAARPIKPVFSCNCILNFVYGGLEGGQPLGVSGHVTFGEIAYVLLNQTLVYLELEEVGRRPPA